MTGTIRIAMWSGPRNISTAMMRSWEARADTAVVDEPFYAAYLAETGIEHPMRAEIMVSQSTRWAEVAAACASDGSAPIVFQKHMSQHMVPAAPLAWMGSVRHAFLIRPPAEVAASFKAKYDAMRVEDLGFHRQADLFDHITRLTGRAPPVIEARDVLENPDGLLRALCAALDVSFDPAMLSWAPGRRSTDGVWATHWYANVEKSTGFGAPTAAAPVPPGLEEVVATCQPAYEKLARAKLLPL